MHQMIWPGVIANVIIACITPALADPVYCSTWQGVTTCSSPNGYVSHESTWNGITSGDNNRGDRWTSWRWRDTTITTSTSPPER